MVGVFMETNHHVEPQGLHVVVQLFGLRIVILEFW